MRHVEAGAALTKEKRQADSQLALSFYDAAVKAYPEHLPSQLGLAQV